jgi:biopolymer transport protein TolR
MRAEINVTPLIDVMLVLLILFMLVTPVAPRGLETRVPEPAPSRPPSAPPPPASVVVTIEAAAYTLNQTPLLTIAELESLLRERLATRADKTVFVKADLDVKSGRIVEAMDVARSAGADRIGFVLPE